MDIIWQFIVSNYVIAFFMFLVIAKIATDLWLERKYPGFPVNSLTSQWRTLWNYVNYHKDNFDLAKTLERIIKVRFEWAKWLLTLTALAAVAQKTDNMYAIFLAKALVSCISLYILLFANQLLNAPMHSIHGHLIFRIINFALALWVSLVLSGHINKITNSIADSFMEQPEETIQKSPAKKRSPHEPWSLKV